MEFFTKLSDHTAEYISGGKNDKWQSPFDDTEQVVPPGQLKQPSSQPGLQDDPPGSRSGVPLRGEKRGIAKSDIGIVPRGWTV